MSEYKTMRVPVEAWEDAKQRKEAAGLTWGEWLEQARVDNDSTTPEQSLNEAALAEALADYLINGEQLPERVADELGGGRR